MIWMPSPSPGPEVDTPQALKDWVEDIARGLDLEAARRPGAGEL